MAPSPLTHSHGSLHARQQVPACVTSCMVKGDISGCSSLTDYACLCTSTQYASSVGTCWARDCTADEMTIGQAYSANMCAVFTGGSNGTEAETTPTAPEIAPSSTQTPIDVTRRPELYGQAFVNVQAIMSSICAALLVAAIILGFMACRSRIRRDREVAERSTWTGVGSTYTGMDKSGRSQLFSRNDPTTSMGNFGAASSNFGGTTLNDHTMSINRMPLTNIHGERVSVNRPNGFTNRLTLNERTNEEYEMQVKSSPESPGKESLAFADTPTTVNTRIDEYGSTVELTPKLSYDGGRGKPI